MPYRIKLDSFEGPLDLLLFFITRDKINIYDIPIADITKEFLEYLKLMSILNIRIAGEFILMAAMLMQIKTRMLLPKVKTESDEEILDPRTDLVNQLLEYKQFKEAAGSINTLNDEHSQSFSKGSLMPIENCKEKPTEYLRNVTLFGLMSIFKNILDRLPETKPYEIEHEQIHLEEQRAFLLELIGKNNKISFNSLIPHLTTKLKIVVTFIALLEMIYSKQLVIIQKRAFDDIVLLKGK